MKQREATRNPAPEYRYGNLIEVQHRTASDYDHCPHSYHYHNCLQMILLRKGSLKYWVGNLPREAAANDILLFGQELPHGIISFSEDVKGMVVHISHEVLPMSLDALDTSAQLRQFIEGLKFGYLFRSPALASTTAVLCRRMGKATGFLKLSLLFRLLHHLAEESTYERLVTDQKEIRTDLSVYESPVERTFRFLYAHYHEHLTLEMIADHANQNASALCRSFKRVSGYTLFQFINRLRIEKGCSLLRNTSLNVTQIAYQVGFSSLTHFHTQFKRLTGTIPSEYKRLCP